MAEEQEKKVRVIKKAKKFFEKKSKFESFLKENNIVFKNGKWIDEESGLEIVK